MPKVAPFLDRIARRVPPAMQAGLRGYALTFGIVITALLACTGLTIAGFAAVQAFAGTHPLMAGRTLLVALGLVAGLAVLVIAWPHATGTPTLHSAARLSKRNTQ